uniref:AB hydrolase-1 domain-containing protein n=1 Tax=Corethron hystrix TaxID=216773 RepID=A0A7S1BVF2_9STRA|mmetsp:Transcript_42571/g.99874  ORF Transcript_42571/g.99874 Transcript_42571/m.99874 type:complete len:112 (+) Transcript_42571:536-871(+)
MPDYHKSSLSRFWGYSFADTVAALGAAIEPHYKRGSPVHLVGHDWGSYICQLYVKKFPASVSKLVLLDVGKETVHIPKISNWWLHLYDFPICHGLHFALLYQDYLLLFLKF